MASVKILKRRGQTPWETDTVYAFNVAFDIKPRTISEIMELPEDFRFENDRTWRPAKN